MKKCCCFCGKEILDSQGYTLTVKKESGACDMDNETGFYYLQSRYYDPVICRFINADEYSDTDDGLLGFNMFAYCLNDPMNRTDGSGNWSLSNLAKVAIGVVAIAGLAVATVATGPLIYAQH